MNSYNNVTHYQVRSKSCILDENKVSSKEANLGLGAGGGSREGRKQKNFLDMIIGVGLQRATIHK